MKTKLTMLLLAGGLGVFAQTAPDPSTTAQTPAPRPAVKAVKKKPAPVPTQPFKIPASAVKTPEGNYRFVDAAGKAWLYRDTPWGVTRQLEGATPAGRNTTAVATGQAGGTVQTPFGPSKVSPEAPHAAASGTNAQPEDHITAVADGDTIHFEKPTPFGMTKWQKNKNDLTPAEQKVWDREQAKRNQ